MNPELAYWQNCPLLNMGNDCEVGTQLIQGVYLIKEQRKILGDEAIRHWSLDLKQSSKLLSNSDLRKTI